MNDMINFVLSSNKIDKWMRYGKKKKGFWKSK